MNRSFLLLIVFFTSYFSFSQTIRYVTPTGAGLKNGSSWTNALSGADFRDHIFSATTGTQYWLASGLYRPMSPINLSNGISVYGGFSGNETGLYQRNTALNVTTIWPVSNGFYIANPHYTTTVVVDGVTISSGSSSKNTTLGGFGAGIYLENGGSVVTINNVKFVNNVAPTSGGAIYIKGTNAASPSITNCNFENNSATGAAWSSEGSGGAIFIDAISVGSRLEIKPHIKNCNFESNNATAGGGAIAIQTADNVPCHVMIEKCTFNNNKGTEVGGAISAYSRGGRLTFWCSKNYFKGNNGGAGGAIALLAWKTNAIVEGMIERSVFVNNSAGGRGGAISNGYNTSTEENSKLGTHRFSTVHCDFVNNSASKGNTIYNQGAAFTGAPIINSIFYNYNKGDEIVNLDYNDNVLSPLEVSHSVFYPNAYPGTTNINSDPLFYNLSRELGTDGIIGTTDDGLQLSCASPAINKGYNGHCACHNGDITGNNLSGGVVDIGAYEQSGTAVIPSVSIEATSTSVCLGTGITFTASVTNFSSNPYYNWKKNGVAVGSGGNTYTDKTLLNNDVITCVVTTNKNSEFICQTTDTATSNSITMIGTTPEVPTAVSPQIFCSGATINDLKATGTDIKWYGSAIGGDPLTTSTVLSGGQIYYVNQTINGCESTRVAVTVTTKSTPWPTAWYSQAACNPATVSNLVATGTDIKWYDSTEGGVPLSPSAALSTKTYYVTQTLNSCENFPRKPVNVTVNTPKNPTFTPVSPVCAGATLAALPTYSTNSIYGIWNPAIDNTKTTDYTFTPTTGQCANTATMTITVNPKVTPTFTPVAAICSGATLAALPTTSNNSISGTWNPAIDNTKTTDYTFTPTTGQCANTATMTITVNPKVTPTFTPVAAICSGATLAALPTTSNNSISGTWNPAIDNTKTTDYTFTPDIGQCASIASMTILVNNVSKPIGESTQTFVQGQTLSNINISGMGIEWYDSDFDATNQTNPLVTTTPLLNGKTYYATQTINGCSSKALAILVMVTLDKNIFELSDGIKVIPNPFSDSFNISIDSSDGQTVFIHIYDLVGKLIEARELSASGLKHASFGDNFATGLYNIIVTQGDRYKTLRVIKK